MPFFSYELMYTEKKRLVFLRELNGYDELMLNGSGSLTAIELLNNVMCQPIDKKPGASIRAESIAIADRDFLLSRIYKYTYGSRIQCTVDCKGCNKPFDLDFLLDDLLGQVRKPVSLQIDNQGYFITDEELQFRLPNGEDELATWGLGADEAEAVMLQRCMIGSTGNEIKNKVQEKMEELAPVMLIDINANCPECGHKQDLRFDMQSFLLARRKNEMRLVAAEVHSIA